MKKALLLFITLIFISGICVVTCPKHDDHSKAINSEINKFIDRKISEDAQNDSEKALAFLASSLCSNISEYFIDSKLYVDNHFLFSVGKITINGESKIISIGVLNHIFTDIESYLNEEFSKYSDSIQDDDGNENEEFITENAYSEASTSKSNYVSNDITTNKNKNISKSTSPQKSKTDELKTPAKKPQSNNITTTNVHKEVEEAKTAKTDITESVFIAVDQMPQFPGGDAALMKFLSNNINYPRVAMENGVQGRVIVQFIVTKNGSIGEVKIVRSVDRDLDNEAIRLCKSLPNFIPGRMGGKPVNVWYTLPITFKLNN